MSFPQTPGPALPGAFLNTPAVASRFNTNTQQDPVRRRLFPQPGSRPDIGAIDNHASFGANPGSIVSQNANDDDSLTRSSQPPASPLSPLAKAAGFINDALTIDECYPELDRYCRQISSEYNLTTIDSPWAPFQQTHHFQIPQSVFEQYDRAEVATSMGLFAELNHAWVAIDNCLYLWDYTHPNPELVGYEDSQHTITAVKLVAPKPGVFNSVISHILVVATVQEMVLIGIAASETATGSTSIQLYGTKMSLPLRGDTHLITGSATGRIFFASQTDTDICELYYQQEEKWFSSRTGKINHSYPGWSAVVPNPMQWRKTHAEHTVDLVVDDSRNLLYSLSNTSTVRTYYIEAPDKLTKVIEKTKNDFLRDIAHALSVGSPLLGEHMEIVSICPVSATEDNKVHLMAVTNTGCRLFMSATSASSYMPGSSNQAPQSMQLQSIKFPPPENGQRRFKTDPFNGPGEVRNVQSRALEPSRRGVRFPPGYFLDFVRMADRPDIDQVFISAPDSGRIKNGSRTQALKYYEHASWIDINSRAEDIGLITKPFAATNQPMGFGNELAVQFDNPDGGEFAILTNTGVYIMRRRRFIDIFASVIRSTAGDEGLKTEVNRFQSSYGRVETITAALAVACRQGDSGRFGVGRSAIDQATLDRARQVFINFGGNPTLPEQDGQPATVEMVRPSSRHGAIALYLSRLVRSLWRSRVVLVGSNEAGGLVVKSAIPQPKLRDVQDSVIALRGFLSDNRSFIQGLSGASDLQRAASKQEEVALQGEHQAMHAVEVLMTDITEGISFVMTLFEERVSDIYARLEGTSQESLKKLTYECLFSQTPGKELAKVLVKAIVNRNIENGSNVETVADALRRKCGSFCSADDVVVFKAQEQLKRASEPSLNANVSRTLLHESLKHFQKVAGSLSQANLESAIKQYIQLRYYAGAIQLCLTVADMKDRGKSALYWVNDGKPAGDPRASAFDQRRVCYDLIHQVLLDLDAASSREPEVVDNKPTLIATKRAEAYDVVNNSTDEVFHVDLYDWYIEQGWTERLLAIDSPYVTAFLRRLASKDVIHAELLCRFYTMRTNYFGAAQVQSDLAQSDFSLSIKDRLQLLSKAKTNASVMTAGVSRQEQQLLNHDVTELLDVANIQDDLLERLKSDTRIPPERQPEIQKALDGKIQPLSDLFNLYADQAGYYDLCLIIYHVADFHNPTTIAQTWTSLIQQTHDEVVDQLAAFQEETHRTGVAPGDPPPQPYESLVGKIEEICHRSSKDSFIFPVASLMPDICRYAVENAQDNRIGADVNWPVDLFLHLAVSHDLVVRVLETMFEAQEIPFRGSARARLVEWICHAVSQWIRELGRQGRPDVRLEPWVGDLMAECDNWASANVRGVNEGGKDPRDIAREVKDVRRAVDGLVIAPVGSRSIGFF
ncbi:Non-repetitive/WGA-negative nucleoporin C-terminal-domain-containing protein [Xylaria bambusicola]|uniref:Non-repetitive/WGA-negative nucleoporin C-terminal-domain-containing protein n=1 Tax=Xylaria bambusicola TaxID=326684 RepID=UPI0020076AD7|nr:Non-repetitive/WGA-negative nucleoporin C-terminal-domain-containing protein [Xylaria bambusicola]KAI0520709.1 Non-repetitive/WGA-negative nucleoporin C-terminal-domain-containing protein [Xylaria bambusicola]